jgi:hypothetical protein
MKCDAMHEFYFCAFSNFNLHQFFFWFTCGNIRPVCSSPSRNGRVVIVILRIRIGVGVRCGIR